jgi:hypothetical protein
VRACKCVLQRVACACVYVCAWTCAIIPVVRALCVHICALVGAHVHTFAIVHEHTFAFVHVPHVKVHTCAQSLVG